MIAGGLVVLDSESAGESGSDSSRESSPRSARVVVVCSFPRGVVLLLVVVAEARPPMCGRAWWCSRARHESERGSEQRGR